MSKIKNGGLDQYGTELFEQQKFGIAGVEGVTNIGYKYTSTSTNCDNIAFDLLPYNMESATFT